MADEAKGTTCQWPSRWQESELVEISQNGLRVQYVGREGDIQPLLGANSLVLFGDPICVPANNPIPGLLKPTTSVDNGNTTGVIATGSSTKSTTVVNNECYYFEIQTRSLYFGGHVAIGFAPRRPGPVQVGSMPGETQGSIGLHSDGEAYDSTDPSAPFQGMPISPPFELNQVVGCGIYIHSRKVFFTINGTRLDATFTIPIAADLYPVVGMDSVGSVVDANFGAGGFLWEGNVINSSIGATRSTELCDASESIECDHNTVNDVASKPGATNRVLMEGLELCIDTSMRDSIPEKPISPLLKRLYSGRSSTEAIEDVAQLTSSDQAEEAENATADESEGDDDDEQSTVSGIGYTSDYNTETNQGEDGPPQYTEVVEKSSTNETPTSRITSSMSKAVSSSTALLPKYTDSDLAVRTVDRFSKSMTNAAELSKTMTNAAERTVNSIKDTFASFIHPRDEITSEQQQDLHRVARLEEDLKAAQTHLELLSQVVYNKLQESGALQSLNPSQLPTRSPGGKISPAGLYRASIRAAKATKGDNTTPDVPGNLRADVPPEVADAALSADSVLTSLPPQVAAALVRSVSSASEVCNTDTEMMQPTGFTQELTESCERIQVRLMNRIRHSKEAHVLDYLLKLHDQFDYLLNMHKGLVGAIEQLGTHNSVAKAVAAFRKSTTSDGTAEEQQKEQYDEHNTDAGTKQSSHDKNETKELFHTSKPSSHTTLPSIDLDTVTNATRQSSNTHENKLDTARSKTSQRRDETPQLDSYNSTTNSIQQLLSMLRAGNTQEQINAATALSHLVKEQTHNSIVLKAGGIHILTRLCRSSRATSNAVLRTAVVRSIAAIVSSSCVPVRQFATESATSPTAFTRLGTSSESQDQPFLTPHRVAGLFEAELTEIVNALGWLLNEQQSAVLRAENSRDKPNQNLIFQQACTKHMVALAFANLCLVFSFRDSIGEAGAMEQTDSTLQESRSTRVNSGWVDNDSITSEDSIAAMSISGDRRESGGVSTNSSGGEAWGSKRNHKSPEYGAWAVTMAKQALPHLVSICNTRFPEPKSSSSKGIGKTTSFKGMKEAMFSGRNEWHEASRLAAFSLARIAQYQKARMAMIERNVLSPLVTMLKSADSELVLHSVTAVAALCSQNDGSSRHNEWEVFLFGVSSNLQSTANVFALGYITAQIITSKILRPLVHLANDENITPGVRGSVAAAIASLATRPQARKFLLAEKAIPAIMNLARISLRSHEPTSNMFVGLSTPRHSTERETTSTGMGGQHPGLVVVDSAEDLVLGISSRSNQSTTVLDGKQQQLQQRTESHHSHPSLNAGNTELRRRLSNHSFSGLEEMLKRKLVVAQSSTIMDVVVEQFGTDITSGTKSSVVAGTASKLASLTASTPRLSSEVPSSFGVQCSETSSKSELRYIAAATYHLTDGSGTPDDDSLPRSSATAMSPLRSLLNEQDVNSLVSMAACDDPLVQLYAVRTLAALSNLGNDACSMLIDGGVAPVLMLLMTAGTNPSSITNENDGNGTSSNSSFKVPQQNDASEFLPRVLKELRLQSSMTLGNVSNADIETRLKIMSSGGVSRLLDVIKDLIRFAEFARAERLAYLAASVNAASTSSRHSKPNTVKLKARDDDTMYDGDHDLEFTACDTEVLHQSVRTIAGLCEALSTESTSSSKVTHIPAKHKTVPLPEAVHSSLGGIGRKENLNAVGATAAAATESSPQVPRTPQYQKRTLAEPSSAPVSRTESTRRRPSGSTVAPEFGRNGEAVHLLIYLLRNVTAEVVLTQTCRTLAAASRIPGVIGAAHRTEIATGVLDTIANLAMGGRGHMDRELKRTAESVLVALGFQEGCTDLQVCNNDVQGLRDWFDMDHALEKQQLVDTALHTVSASTWLIPLENSDLPNLESMFESEIFATSPTLPRHSTTFQGVRRSSHANIYSTSFHTKSNTIKEKLRTETNEESSVAGAHRSSTSDGALQTPHTTEFPARSTSAMPRLEEGASLAVSPSRNPTMSRDDSEHNSDSNIVEHAQKPLPFQAPRRAESSHTLLGLPIKGRWGVNSAGWRSHMKRLVSCGTGEFVSEEDWKRERIIEEEEFANFYASNPANLKLKGTVARSSNAVESIFEDGQHVKWYLESVLDRASAGTGSPAAESSPRGYRVREEAAVAHRPGTRGFEEVPPYWVTLQLQMHFPSMIHRRQLYTPLCYFTGEPDEAICVDALLPSKPRAILLPPRTYFSFRFERIIGRILSKNGKQNTSADATVSVEDVSTSSLATGKAPYVWTLVLRDSKFFGDFFKRLVNCLYRYPTITSLCFTRKTSVNGANEKATESDDAFAQLLSDLPPRINWCTFDNVLTAQGVKLIAFTIQTRRNCCIAGLAIRNHKFTLNDLRPIIKLLSLATKQNESGGVYNSTSSQSQVVTTSASIPATTPPSSATTKVSFKQPVSNPIQSPNRVLQRQALRWIDLSGNNLGDVGCAAVIRALSKEDCMVDAVDISRNHVGNAARELMDALVGPSGPGSSNGFVSTNCTLRALHLCENGIGAKAISRLLLGLGAQHKLACKLAVLDLDSNGMHGSDRTYTQAALGVLLRNNKTLREIGLCNLNLEASCGDEICKSLSENSTLHFLRLEGNSNIALDDLIVIERQLVYNRKTWSQQVQLSPTCTAIQPAKVVRSDSEDSLLGEVEFENVTPSSRTTTSNVGKDATVRQQVPGETETLNLEVSSEDIPPDTTSSLTSSQIERDIHSQDPVDRDGDDRTTKPVAQLLPPLRHSLRRTASDPVGISDDSTSATHTPQSLSSTQGVVAANVSDTTSRVPVPPRLSVLFSAPLAMRDNENNYYPIETLDFKVEKELLWQSFVDASRDIDVSFGFATSERLRSEVTMRCRAIHFSGHGNPNWLSFEDGRGGLHVLTPENVRQLCASGSARRRNHENGQRLESNGDESGSVEFVFVSACYSEFAGNAFVQAGIPHVVCVDIDNGKLLDKAAQVFTRAFYLSLAVGDSIQDAFEIARDSVAVSPSHSAEESKKFKLLPVDANHNVPLFPNCRRVSRWPSARSAASQSRPGSGGSCDQWPGGFLPNKVEDFLGRNVDVYKTLTYILNRRLVTLTGTTGVGKTALAVATAHYAAERNLFPDGVIFVRAEGISSVDRLLSTLHHIAYSSVSSDPSNRNFGDSGEGSEVEDQLVRLCAMLRTRKCLLLIDHVDQLIESEYERMRHFVGRLLDNTRGMRILLTTCGKYGIGGLPGYPEAINQVQPLKPRDSAKLFVRLSPHNHPLGDMDFRPVGMDSLDTLSQSFDLLDALAEDDRVCALGGHPRTLVQFSYQMSKDDFVQLVEECRLKLRHELAQIVSSVPTL